MEWSADRLSTFATGYWSAAALIAAVELRVFDVIGETDVPVTHIAETINASADRLSPLLDALVAGELLVKSGNTYAIASSAKPWLLRNSPTCLLDALVYNGDLYARWGRLSDVVRGAEPPAGHASLKPDIGATRRFVRAMDAKARAFSPAIVPHIDLSGAQSLLDVGSGPGTLSRMLALKNPALNVTLLDLSGIICEAQSMCADDPARDRLTFHKADYHADPLPTGFDAILYAGALHQETPASAEKLFNQLKESLKPGGRLFVVDLMLNAQRTSPAFAALFQLNMLLIRPGSRVFSVDEVRQLLLDGGWCAIQSLETDSCYRMVTARL